MKRKFNNGKPYHGDKVIGGKLRGTTDTDYFYFFCPQCEGDHVMRILDYDDHYPVHPNNRYNDCFTRKAAVGFTLVFKLHCEKCNLTDFVKISNEGWQAGQINHAQRERLKDKISQTDLIAMLRLNITGTSQKELAMRYSVSQNTITNLFKKEETQSLKQLILETMAVEIGKSLAADLLNPTS